MMKRFLVPHKTDKRQRVDDEGQEPSTSTEKPEEENVDDDSTQKNTARRPPGPNDISLLPDSGPTCPDLKKYPSHMQGGQKRSFNNRWHDLYSWLEYSVIEDAAYCFACRHFTTSHGRAEQSFTHDGFKNWRKATMSLKAHDASASHKCAMQAWVEFKLQKVRGAPIYQAIDAGHAKTVVENRRYIGAVIDALLYTACQNVAQRGHREGDESSNRGNFLELLTLLARYDPTVAKKINGPGNAKYTHLDIQNELFEIIASMIRKEISDEVKQAEHFAIIVDETKDVAKKEQISVVVRYLHDQELHEEFLDFTPAEGLDADSLLQKIKETLAKCEIDQNTCVSQCYDGAAVMSGCSSGVQERFRRDVPQAVYIHCYAHRLNLALVDCVNSIRSISEFFVTIQSLYNFFSSSVVHQEFLKFQKELNPQRQHTELKRLSDTRWACQHSACQAVKRTLPAIIATLKHLMEGANVDRASGARSLAALLDHQFVTNLVLMESSLQLTKTLSDQLQSPDLQLASAVDLVEAVMSSLTEMRNEESWEQLRKQADELCQSVGIRKQLANRRQRAAPRYLDEFIITSGIGQDDDLNDSDVTRRRIYYSVIDKFLSELRRRFSGDACQVLIGASALNPNHPSFLNKDKLSGMAANYGVEDKDLSVELHQLRRLIARKVEQGMEVGTPMQLAIMLEPYKDAFIDLYKLVRISVTLPVNSASCERSFSCLKQLKTYLRNSSGDKRTSNLAAISINPQRAKMLDKDMVIDAFAANHRNRRIILK